ncbi:hypothetical protein AYI69_g11308 [Smittium culicis]|uniref:Reverse transcriptase domain-containing protein n=1 Tax=Smittium culicis TaxID=133412 RepID=A0A1R1WZL8_9FUNG|nr:hypothetical protein AYI69_g11308 [Smittium culicis]
MLEKIRNEIVGINFFENKMCTLSYAEDIIIGVSNDEDVRKLVEILKKHSKASNARLNEEKTVCVKIGNSQTKVPFNLLPQNHCFEYLGVIFNSLGIDNVKNEEKILSSIKNTSKVLKL